MDVGHGPSPVPPTTFMVHGVSPVGSTDIPDDFSSISSFPIGLENS
jgi:hypothetical protein